MNKFAEELEDFKERALSRKLEGDLLESLVIELYGIGLGMPAFREELSAQKGLDDVWLQMDTDRVFEGLVQDLWMKRLKQLPARQLTDIFVLLDEDTFKMAEENRQIIP